jgi:hypothetical protein
MSPHFQQRSRDDQIRKLQSLIREYGGWGYIVSNIGEERFIYLASLKLGATPYRIREYFQTILQAGLAEQRLEALRGEANAEDQ